MDLRGLGAFLSAIAGYFSAQAGAKAGQLQGLLTGEELTERRKRMQMAEEAHREEIETRRLQRQLQEAEERRRAELFPFQRDLLQQQVEQEKQMFPLRQRALATQVETGELSLLNQRLWSLYEQGVSPSQITDPVLRQQYEAFFNFRNAMNSLSAVFTQADLDAVLNQVDEAFRPTLEILGRAKLFENQHRQQMIEKQMQGLDLNLAMGEFELRNRQIQSAINIVLNNIEAEGANWDKRSAEQKIQAVQKWLKQAGLDGIVPPDFANMFQRVQSSHARQLAILQAQIEMQTRASLTLGRHQFAWNRALQNEAWWGNIVAGALQGQIPQGVGGGGAWGGGTDVAPVGFRVPPSPAVFNNAPDNRGNRLNQSLLNKYTQIPFEVSVPYRVGTQMTEIPLSRLQGEVSRIYGKLGLPNPNLTFDDINTLATFDAGLYLSYGAKDGMPMGWNTALQVGVDRVLSVLKSLPYYQTDNNYRKVVNDWERAWRQRQQRTLPSTPQGAQGQPARQGQGRQPQQGQRTAPRTAPTMTQGDIPRGRIGREQ